METPAAGPLNEAEEFEFRARMEAESGATPPMPTMGQVAANAVPKGLANFLDTPITLSNLIMMGIANLPYAGHFPGIQSAAQEPELKQRPAMDLGLQTGVIDPAKDPQTGPQRIVDTAIQAAVNAAAIPAGGVAGAAKGAVVGGVSGAAAQTTKEVTKPIVGETGSTLLAVAVGLVSPLAIKKATDSGKTIIASVGQKEVLKEAQQYGFQVEPSKVRTPPSVAESVAGPNPIAQEAAMNNQRIANQLTARALGMSDDAALTPALFQAVKTKASTPYRELDQYFKDAKAAGSLPYFSRYHSQSLTDEWVAARQHASELWKSYWADPKIEVKRAAESASAAVKAVEADIDMVAKATGHADLLPRLQAGRQMYARVNAVEEVTNAGSYNVSMPKLGKMVQSGEPVTDELSFLGRFARAFPKVARETEGLPPVGVSATDAIVAEGLATTAAAGSGSAAGLLAGGVPLLRGPARRHVLSPNYQKSLLVEPPPPTPTGPTVLRGAMTAKTLGENQE